MKKFIALLTMFLAFGVVSNAQSKKDEERLIAQKRQIENDINSIAKIVNLSDQLKSDFVTLLVMRGQAMQEANQEERKHIFVKYTQKMMGTLSAAQVDALKAKDAALYSRLTEYKE